MYTYLLECHSLNQAENIPCVNYVFQQEHATVHSEKDKKKMFEEYEIPTVDWRANNSILNPLLEVWTIIMYIYQTILKSRINIVYAICEVWRILSHQQVQSLLNFMP